MPRQIHHKNQRNANNGADEPLLFKIALSHEARRWTEQGWGSSTREEDSLLIAHSHQEVHFTRYRSVVPIYISYRVGTLFQITLELWASAFYSIIDFSSWMPVLEMGIVLLFILNTPALMCPFPTLWGLLVLSDMWARLLGIVLQAIKYHT